MPLCSHTLYLLWVHTPCSLQQLIVRMEFEATAPTTGDARVAPGELCPATPTLATHLVASAVAPWIRVWFSRRGLEWTIYSLN